MNLFTRVTASVRAGVRQFQASRPVASRAYEGASRGRRMKDWYASKLGPNALLYGDGEILRDRARDIVRNDPWVSRAVTIWVSNAIGTGITPTFLHPDLKIRKRLKAAWDAWVPDADADGVHDFYGLQKLTCRSVREAGEVLTRLRKRRLSDGLTIPLQLQTLEAEHLPFYRLEQTDGGNIVKAGIEFDGIGRRVAYHLYQTHPGEVVFPGSGSFETRRVPADQIIHNFDPIRPGQIRGEPSLQKALIRAYNLHRYDDAELERKKTASGILGFIRKLDPSSAVNPQDEDETASQQPPGVDQTTIEPNTFINLLPGEDITLGVPPGDAQYEPYYIMQLRAIAVAADVMFEQLSGNYSKVNYSSYRAAALEFRRLCEQFQYLVMVHQYCRRVSLAWLDAAALSGVIDAADYARNPGLYRMIEWRPPKWQWVDPLKDIMAEKMAVRCGFRSRSQVITEQAFDPDQVMQEIEEDRADAKRRGLVFDSDPNETSVSGDTSAKADAEALSTLAQEQQPATELVQ